MGFDWRYRARINIGYGDGAVPNEGFFRRGRSVWQGDPVHANPRFFKVRWHILTAATASRLDMDRGALTRLMRSAEQTLAFAEAMEIAQDLQSRRITMMMVSRALKRIAPDTPWDAARVTPARQAIAYDEDPDPEFFGHR